MNITLSLSSGSIESAIRSLQQAKDDFSHDVEQTLDVIAKDAAEVAQSIDGSMASVDGMAISETESKVIASGGDSMIIAEFGAGNATLDPGAFFETSELDSWVFPGSYSLFKGTMEYYLFHQWEFPRASGHWYEEVKARQGMYSAKLFIMSNSSRIAREMILR